MDEIGARRLAPQLGEEGQADGGGQDVGLSSRLSDRNAIDGLAQGMPARCW